MRFLISEVISIYLSTENIFLIRLINGYRCSMRGRMEASKCDLLYSWLFNNIIWISGFLQRFPVNWALGWLRFCDLGFSFFKNLILSRFLKRSTIFLFPVFSANWCGVMPSQVRMHTSAPWLIKYLIFLWLCRRANGNDADGAEIIILKKYSDLNENKHFSLKR